MPAIQRFRVPLMMASGMMMAAVAFAGPANAADPYPPPAPPPTVLGVVKTAPKPAALPPQVLGVSKTAPALAFTGTNAVGIGALGGVLLLGGGLMLVSGKRRKSDI